MRVTVEVRKAEPPADDLSAWDHVVEGPLEVTSGRLIVRPVDDTGLEDSEPSVRARQFELPPGSYRVRVYSAGWDTVVDEQGDDPYRLSLFSR